MIDDVRMLQREAEESTLLDIWHISNLITYIGMAAAVAGMGVAAGGRPGYAMIFLVVAGLCDLFDGVFARRFHRTEAQKAFGVQIDSLADMLSFVALPVVALYAAGLCRWYHLLVLAVYAIAAASRLAFFNVTQHEGDSAQPVSYYRGLPVTYMALFLPLLWLGHYWVSAGIFEWILTAAVLVIALLFVLDFKNRKPGGVLYGVFGLLALLVGAAIFVLEKAA